MHAVLATQGTDGDIVPYYLLARELRGRGHRVTLATHEHYQYRAHEAGLEFATLVTSDETEALLTNADLWNPFKGPLFLGRWGARMVSRQHAVLKSVASDPATVLIANPGVLAARVISERAGNGLISAVLQPWIFPSLLSPPRIMGGLPLSPAWPRRVGRLYFRLIHLVGACLLGRVLREIRTSPELPPIKRLFEWWLSPDVVLGLFADRFGPLVADWPGQLKVVGFPRYTQPREERLPAELEDFCLGDLPVIAFSFGSGMRHAKALFQICAEACFQAGIRGVFVSREAAVARARWPGHIRAVEFIPFGNLFPRTSAIVHHGGIGTLACALQAGIPQLILPFAFDQEDNALRVERLGVGRWLPRKRRTITAIAAALANILNVATRERAVQVARELAPEDGIAAAADLIDDYGARSYAPAAPR